eukprot:CAMPEP_0114624986 /NCGR_PEP_ID=MMETSP0168-20121206/11042_1 /TAXON_ID=95228 ORGANISM="Vannella sp., Strain DIVA3 517/6/12" /NCGR_SAMPLE_ID=MMETSP0168 /ASSEMBLY_ACC=CAM_ASM_000044 /LENGTH=377 /DNA_ID=CAMNT_0001836263 /DNA_START=132 /DNA_END=1262 /DNA_ORIENTATION=-
MELNSCCEVVQELSSYLSDDLDTLATKHGLDAEGFLCGELEEDSSCMSKYSLWNSDTEEAEGTSCIHPSPITDGIADLDAYDAITNAVFNSPASPPLPSPPRSTFIKTETEEAQEEAEKEEDTPGARSRLILSTPLMETTTPPMPSPARTTPFLQPRQRLKRLCPPRAPGVTGEVPTIPTALEERVVPQAILPKVASSFKPTEPVTPSPAKTTPFLRPPKSERRRLRPPSVHMSPKTSRLPAPVPLAELEMSAKKKVPHKEMTMTNAGATTTTRQTRLCTTPLRPRMPSPPRTIGFLPSAAERRRLQPATTATAPDSVEPSLPVSDAVTPAVARTPMGRKSDGENLAQANGFPSEDMYTPIAAVKATPGKDTPMGGM